MKKVIVAFTLIVFISVFAYFLNVSSSMGEGDPEVLMEMTEDLTSMNSGELAAKYGSSYHHVELSDGAILALSQDSHSDPNGGNMVILFPDGSNVEFMGHICGNSYFNTMFQTFLSEHKADLVTQHLDSDSSEDFNINSLLTITLFKQWLPSHLETLKELDG
jgi:hypothetical protein